MTDYNQYFDENMWLKDEHLWPLRQQISLGSLYTSDYKNSYAIPAKRVQNFFDNFWERYCEERSKEDGITMELANAEFAKLTMDEKLGINVLNVDEMYSHLQFLKYDNEATLLDFYHDFEYNPLHPHVLNVDIHRDFHRSIQVIAADEDEAEEIASEMMGRGEIPYDTFEEGDIEFDTDWQPDDDFYWDEN